MNMDIETEGVHLKDQIVLMNIALYQHTTTMPPLETATKKKDERYYQTYYQDPHQNRTFYGGAQRIISRGERTKQEGREEVQEDEMM